MVYDTLVIRYSLQWYAKRKLCIYTFGRHVSISTSHAAHSLSETLHCALFAICFVCKSVCNISYSWYNCLGIRARNFPRESGMFRSDLPIRYCWCLGPSRQLCMWETWIWKLPILATYEWMHISFLAKLSWISCSPSSTAWILSLLE